jgi:hypothetical protein
MSDIGVDGLMPQLRQAYQNYKKDLIETAESCSKEIKKIAEVFKELGVPDTYVSLEDPDNSKAEYGLAWESNTILYWYDSPENVEPLAGAKAKVRAFFYPRLDALVRTAYENIEQKRRGLSATLPHNQVLWEECS